MTSFHQGVAQAIELVFSHRTTHLYCQNSVKQFFREQLAHLVDTTVDARDAVGDMSVDLAKQWENRHEKRAQELRTSLANKKTDFSSGAKSSAASAKMFIGLVLELVEENESERFIELQEAIF